MNLLKAGKKILGMSNDTEALDQVRINQGLILTELYQNKILFNEAEFKVFSQWGEDGLIQFLLRKVGEPLSKSFIEFGVQDFRESNCRFLMCKDNWKGFILDGSEDNINAIKRSDFYWRYGLEASQLFVTKANIDQTLSQFSPSGKVGILSIDIDGNDYWVWESISSIDADIVIIEYNALFGTDKAVVVPYEENFDRTRMHYSNLYWGSSLKALNNLAERKGYFLAGCNGNGNNAFFVNHKHLSKVAKQTVEDAYRPASFRDSRDQDGNLNFLDASSAKELLKDMHLLDLENQKKIKIGEL